MIVANLEKIIVLKYFIWEIQVVNKAEIIVLSTSVYPWPNWKNWQLTTSLISYIFHPNPLPLQDFKQI